METKKRLIDANALKKTMFAFTELLGNESLFIDVIIDAIDSYDPVDAVEVVHGHWIEGSDGSVMCSKCEQVIRYEIGYYCPKCGAKMDGDGNG